MPLYSHSGMDGKRVSPNLLIGGESILLVEGDRFEFFGMPVL